MVDNNIDDEQSLDDIALGISISEPASIDSLVSGSDVVVDEASIGVEDKVEARGFFKAVWNQFVEVYNVYKEVVKSPSLFVKGVYNVMKDIFYKLPKSLITRKHDTSLEKELGKNASIALGISEVITIAGNYAGAHVANSAGADDFTAAAVGGAVGDWVFGASSYVMAYMALSRDAVKKLGYSSYRSFVDGMKVVRDCLPINAALYVSNAPMIAGLLATGLSLNATIGVNTVFAMTMFLGVAKHSAKSAIEVAEEKIDYKTESKASEQ